MSSHRFLITTVVLGATLVGAGVAVITRLQPSTMLRVAQITQPVISGLQPTVQPTLQPTPQSTEPIVQPVQPTQLIVQPPAQPATSASTPVPIVAENPDANLLRAQIRQAIQERNLTMLKSLIRAGALREILHDLKASDQINQINFDNLDAVTWKALEKASSYRCRSIPPVPADQFCFD